MAYGAIGVLSPSAQRLVVEETGRGRDVVTTQHPKTKGNLALEPPFNNRNATSRPAVRTWPLHFIFIKHISIVLPIEPS